LGKENQAFFAGKMLLNPDLGGMMKLTKEELEVVEEASAEIVCLPGNPLFQPFFNHFFSHFLANFLLKVF